jgi:hypothetical protein
MLSAEVNLEFSLHFSIQHSAFKIARIQLMDEQTLRAMVRQAVANHLQTPQPVAPADRLPTFSAHVSHTRYMLPKSDGPCLIEPAVSCNHCGYCESHGH